MGSLDELGDLQRAVMEVVWGLGEGTVQQVREGLRRVPPLAYTTVLSVLQKLEKGGWVTHRAEGRSYVYRATRSREEEGSTSLRTVLQRAFGGNPLMLFQHLLDDETLSDQDLVALRRMVDQRRKGRRDA